MSKSSTQRAIRQLAICRISRAVAASLAAATFAAAGASAMAGTWSDPAAVSPTITGNPGPVNYTSSTPLKDGDVLKNGASATAGPAANTNFYVVGVGSTPSTTIKISNAPGGPANVTPLAASVTMAAAADWLAPANWSGGVPNGVDDVATISADTGAIAIELTKNVTIGTLNFSAATNDLNLMGTVVGNGGPFSTLTFARSAGTPTVTTSGGKSLFFSDSSATATNINGKFVIGGNQGLTFDNQNAIAALPIAGVNSTAGAVKFGYQIDWSRFSGALTLSRGSFAMLSGGVANANGSMPLNTQVVLGTASNVAQMELFGGNANTTIRGLDGNSVSSVMNSIPSGGGSICFGSYSTASDSYTFQGAMGTPISTGTANLNIRILKIGAGTQTFTGNLNIQNGNIITLNGGTLSFGTTGTLGTVSGPGQATTNAAVAVQNMFTHNGEFKMVGTSANPRSQTFGGALIQTNGTGAGASYSQASHGLSTYTLVADPAQPISLTFASLQPRQLPGNVTNGNANGMTSLYRGTNIGSAPGAGVATIKFTAAPTISGTAGTTNYNVLKGALADTSATGTGMGFATYDATNGVRLLAASEQDTSGYPGASTVVNTRLNLPSGATGITGFTTQTLQLDNTSGGAATVTNTGVGLNATGGILISGTDAVTLTGGTLTGTAATDNEDVVIHSTNTAGATIAIAVSNGGTGSRPGWITYNGPGDFLITGTQTVGNSGGIAFNGTSSNTTTLQAAVNSATFLAVNQGKVKLASGASLNTVKPQLIVAAGATFDLNGQSGANLTFDNLAVPSLFNSAGANAAGGIITNSGGSVIDLTINGAQTATGLYFPGSITGNLNLVLGKSGTVLNQVLIGTNTYVGSTRVQAGNTLVIGRYGSLPSGTTVTLGEAAGNTAGILQLGDTNTQSSGGNGSVNQEIAGLLIAGTATTSAVVGGNPNASVLTVNYTGGSPDTYSGLLGGAGANQNSLTLRKIGSGTLVLGGATANTYHGGTVIEGGVLSVANDNKLGNPGSVIGGTPVSPTSGVLNNVVINGATLQVTASTTIQKERGIGLGPTSGGSGGTGTIETNGAATAVSYAGSIASAGNTGTNNLTKTGAGTLVLSGASTYNGNTSVLAGWLNVTGSIANNGSNRVFLATDGDGIFGSSDDNIISRAAGISYVGLGSTEIGGLGSLADLVQGANSLGTDLRVTMRWRPRALAETNGSSPPLPSGFIELASDVFSLTDMANSGGATGTTDPYAIELAYSAALVPGDFAGAVSGGLYLAWLDTSGTPQWKNAIVGNSATGGSAVTGYVGSWAGFAAANSVNNGNIANYLGSWGADPAGDRVWAVLDHNSSFAAVGVPEPASLGLFAIASAALLARRRRN